MTDMGSLTIERKSTTISDKILSSRHLRFNVTDFVPGLSGNWQASDTSTGTTFDLHRPINFNIDDIKLPLANQRWKIDSPEYSNSTFDDLRVGNWPRPTELELERRHKALNDARKVRQEMDIRPLTTTTIIHLLREEE
jgi:hypothetical protein